jgi:hypothetical protein
MRTLRACVWAPLVWVAVTVLSAPSAAEAQPRDQGHVRLAGYLALGVGGDLDWNVDRLSGSEPLDTTVGFGARVELPVHDFVVVGGLFEVLTVEPSSRYWSGEREAIFDFDAWVRLRYVVELTRDIALEPYVGLPFGLTLAVLDDEGGGDRVWPGFNTGVLAGVAFIFQQRFGGFLELGWRHHQVFDERRVFGSNVDLKLVTNQFAMNFGGLFIF